MGTITDARPARSHVIPSSSSTARIPVPPALRGRIDRQRVGETAPRLNLLWPRFLAICDAIGDPDVDPDAEDVASFVSAYDGLVLLGVQFDPGFAQTVEILRRALVGTDADADADGDDELETDYDDDRDELPAVSYPTTTTISSDEALERLIERKAQERKWGDPWGGGPC